MPEELKTCPNCGTKNFTARGLKAHVCKGKNGLVKKDSLSLLKNDRLSLLNVQLDRLETDLGVFTRMGEHFIMQAVIIGLRVYWLKATLPHGKYVQTLESPRFAKYGSLRNLRRYGKAANAFIAHLHIRLKADVEDEELDTIPAKDLPRLEALIFDGNKDLQQQLEAWVGKRSLADLCNELFKPERANPPRLGSGDRPSDDESEEQLDLFLGSWMTFKIGLENKTWVKAPPQEVQAMHGTLKQALSDVEKQLKHWKLL